MVFDLDQRFSTGPRGFREFKFKQAVVRKHNKPRPRVASPGIMRFLEIDRKCNQVVRGQSTPSLKISCKSVLHFSRNLANKEIDRKQYPVPDAIGREPVF